MSSKSNSNQPLGPGAVFRDSILDHVFDSLIEGCQVISPDFKYLYVNDAVARQARTTRSALLGQPMAQVFPGIRETEMFAELQQCMTDRRPRKMENSFAFPDGSSGWFELRFGPVPEGVVILSMDITERKRAEAALRRMTRALTVLSECNHLLVHAKEERPLMSEVCRIITREGNFRMAWIDMNRGAGEQTVLSVDPAAPEQPCRELVRRLKEAAAEDAGPLAATRQTGHTVLRRIHAAQSTTSPWLAAARELGLAASLSLPIGVAPDHIGVLTIGSEDEGAFDGQECRLFKELARDLGYGVMALRAREMRKAAERELARSRAEYRELVANLDDVVFSTDAAGRIRFVSPAVERVFGDTPDAFIGRPFVDLVHPEDRSAVEDCFRAVVAGAAGRCEFRGIDAEGGVHHLRCTNRRRLDNGRAVGIDGVLSDLSEQRSVEAQLKLSQQLEAVARLAGGVAHDFNNLLAVIINSADFALARLDEGHPARSHLVRIQDAGEHAATLTRQLLAFSRKQVLQPVVLNPNDIIARTEGMLRRLLEENIEIIVRLGEGVGNVEVDPGQLEQILMNLAVNARDAMPRGGRLIIETAAVVLDDDYVANHVSAKPGNAVLLCVTDTGAGMDTGTRTRIFEPFFTTKEKGKGTGLGLSTVYGIVKQSGGNIWVYSEPGHGTTFKIYLPEIDAPETEVPQRATVTAALDVTETVLVVEDDDRLREISALILEQAGYRVLTASNGIEALRLLERREKRVDLLLTDVILPDMNGPSLSARLTRIRPELATLYMSGYTDNAIVHHGVLDPGVAFISKPFTSATLTQKVREVLHGGM